MAEEQLNVVYDGVSQGKSRRNAGDLSSSWDFQNASESELGEEEDMIFFGTSLAAIHLGDQIVMGSDGMESNEDFSKVTYTRVKIFTIIPGLNIAVAGDKGSGVSIKEMIKRKFQEKKSPRSVEEVVGLILANLKTYNENGFIVAGRVLDKKLQLMSVMKKRYEEAVKKSHKKGDLVKIGTGARHMTEDVSKVEPENVDDMVSFVWRALKEGIKGDPRSGGTINILVLGVKYVRRLLCHPGLAHIGFVHDETKLLTDDDEMDGRVNGYL